MASRLVTSGEPRSEARALIGDLRADPTPKHLAAEIPQGSTALIVGWPCLTLEALPRRGDVNVLILDVEGQGGSVVHQLERRDVMAEDIDPAHVAGAVEDADLVVLEAAAMGSAAALVDVGNLPAAAVAKTLHKPVWLVAGVGRRLPEPYWQAIVDRVVDRDEPPWLAATEILPLGLVDRVVTVDGLQLAAELEGPDCPLAPELLKQLQ
jgi:hypothetical protein